MIDSFFDAFVFTFLIGEDGISREPYEEVTVDVDPELQGLVIDSMSNRNGNLVEMKVRTVSSY